MDPCFRQPRSALACVASAALVAIALAASLVTLGAAPAGAASRSGSLEVVNPGDYNPLNSGGSRTPFGLALPGAARCPGDSATGGFHIISFLVPANFNPAQVTLNLLLPVPGFPLIANGGPFEGKNTEVGTARIPALPTNFTFSRLKPAELFPAGGSSATWNAGIACVTGVGVVVSYWDDNIVFTASPSDPRGFTWSVVHPVSPSHLKVWALVLITIAVVGGALLWVTGRRRDAGRPVASNDDTARFASTSERA